MTVLLSVRDLDTLGGKMRGTDGGQQYHDTPNYPINWLERFARILVFLSLVVDVNDLN